MSSESPATHALVVCARLPHPPSSGGQKRTLRLLEAAARAGAVPHIVTADPAASASDVDGLRARGWSVDLLVEPPTTMLDRGRQHAARRPSPRLRSVSTHLSPWHGGAPAFVQVEHLQSVQEVDRFPASRWALSTHTVDSDALASIARAEPWGLARVRAEHRARVMRWWERRVVPQATAVLCVSDDDAAHYERLGGTVVVAPNGVDAEILAIPPELPNDEVVLCVGRLDYAPNALGIERFVREGWPRLAAARPAASLRIVGAGMQRSLAAAVARAPRVEAVGEVPDIVDALSAARVVIVPIWEGGGVRLKAVEAIAAARPVVGTPFGVSGLGVVDGRHALVADDAHGLADAAAALLADEARAAALAAEGRRLVQDLEWTRTLAPAEDLYARWVAEAAR